MHIERYQQPHARRPDAAAAVYAACSTSAVDNLSAVCKRAGAFVGVDQIQTHEGRREPWVVMVMRGEGVTKTGAGCSNTSIRINLTLSLFRLI